MCNTIVDFKGVEVALNTIVLPDVSAAQTMH